MRHLPIGARRMVTRYPGFIAVMALLVTWALLADSGWIGRTLLASPGEVVETVRHSFSGTATQAEKFYLHAFYTIQRALNGWLLGIGIGVLVGILVGGFQLLYSGSEPIIEFFRAIPPVLAFPLFLVAFNYGEPAYVWTIVFGCLPVMLLTVARGTRSVSRERMDILKSFGVARWIRLYATAMEIMPSVFLGARITLSIAIIIAVVTEMVFSPRSGLALGALARDSEIDFDTPMFYTCVLTIGVFGYCANVGMRKLEQRLGFAMEAEA